MMARVATGRQPINTAAAGMDPAAALGLIAACGLIATAIALGGAPLAFIDYPSVLLVVLGTLAVTMVSFPFGEFVRAPLVIGQALSWRRPANQTEVARACLMLANKLRGSSLMGLGQEIDQQADKPIVKRGLTMLGDGFERADILDALRLEAAVLQEARDNTQRVLRRAADVAPAMGLIGTLVGLVQMLGQLDDPTAIGPSMAVALLTTLYGAFLAHAVLTPLAERIAHRNDAEQQLLELQLMTVQSLVDGENPRLLETRLNGLLPMSAQLALFD